MDRTDFEQWKAKEVARLLALVETERRYYQEMVANLPAPLVVLAGDRTVVWANRAFRRAFSLTAEELRRRLVDQVLPIEGLADWIREVHSSAAPAPLSGNIGLDTYRISAIPMRNWDDESELETLLILEHVSGSGPIWAPAIPAKAATPAAPALPTGLPAIVWEAGADNFRFRSVFGPAEQWLGYPVDHWLSWAKFFEDRIHPDDRAATMNLYQATVQAAIGAGGASEAAAEFRAIGSSGAALWFRESVRVSGNTIRGVLTPIAQRRQLERQLAAAGRIEALQSFAGKLAHELNNPLMIVTGYAEELLAALPASSPQRNDVTEILAGTERLSAIAARMAEFARRQAVSPSRVDLNELISSIEARLAQAVGENVTLVVEPASGPIFALAEAAQLAHTLELIAGPREGTQERTRVTISRNTEPVNESTHPAALTPGRYAAITLRDDGRGIDPAKQAAAFDPSPSNADLARAYMTVRQWGGDIAYSSELFRGSVFTVYLPLLEPEAASAVPAEAQAAEPVPAAVPAPEPEPLRETVLVVDDEAGIRGLMRKILQRERYVVLEAGSAEEALEIARAHSGSIHLLLTDVMLPGKQGPALAQELTAERPGTKVLYISGYTQEESVRSGNQPPGAKFLGKPFTLGALLGKVRETLES